MKTFILFVLLSILVIAPAAAVAQTNISFVGQLSYQQLHNSRIANLWGYTDELGNEYAIVGVNGTSVGDPGGVSVVDLSDPANPQEIFFVPGPASIWREVKVWGDHAYVTTEAEGGGVTIIDLSPLPQSNDLPYTVFLAPDWTTSHSLFIDENGRMYIFGSSRGNGGAIMYDLLQNPMAPVEVGEYDSWYVHDGYARGDTLYAAHILNGFFTIVDVSNPMQPVLLGSQTTPNLFTHNVWLDDSGQFLFTTDEKTNAFVASYDVSDPTDIQFLDKLQSDPGSGTVPHNTYWWNDFLVTSYYTYGVTIYDAMRPHNLVEVGHYDTTPLTGNGFNGAWGVYPFFGSQRLIVSDIELGLFVLDPTYVRACWLEGVITNAFTGFPVGQATVTIVGLEVSDISLLDGTYGTGHVQAGTFTVHVWAPGYESVTIEGVVLENGQLTILDVVLNPLGTFLLQGSVTDALTTVPVEDAQVVVSNEVYWFSASTDDQGWFTLPAIYEDEYDVLAGRWGWRSTCPEPQTLAVGADVLQLTLEPGYYDDAELDFGWTVTSTATSGFWVRDVPVGTSYLGQPSNPDADVEGDCGDKAWVTGNAGGGAGDDDIDAGWTMLSSPVFDLSGHIDPHVTFYRWFYNAGGVGSAPNDRLEFRLSNGTDTVVAQTLTQPVGLNSWQLSDIRVLDHITPTANMRFHAFAIDEEPGHIVEAGLDLFQVVEMGTIGIQERAGSNGIFVYPNPNDGRFTLTLADGGNAMVEILDATGRTLMVPARMRQGLLKVDVDLPAGTYMVRITPDGGVARMERIVVQRR